MGSSTSKAAKTAVGAAKRQYPQRVPLPPTSNSPSAPPPPTGQPTAPGPAVHPQSQASSTRDQCRFSALTFHFSAPCFTDTGHQPSISMPLILISLDPSVLSAQSSPTQFSRIHQFSIPHHLPHPKALKAPQTSHIHQSFQTLARILH